MATNEANAAVNEGEFRTNEASEPVLEGAIMTNEASTPTDPIAGDRTNEATRPAEAGTGAIPGLLATALALLVLLDPAAVGATRDGLAPVPPPRTIETLNNPSHEVPNDGSMDPDGSRTSPAGVSGGGHPPTGWDLRWVAPARQQRA